jgi:phosphoenolpyruvate carboxylase
LFLDVSLFSPVQGKLRVTIQGETIEQQFGEREVCFRTLDLYTSAVLEACLDPPSAALPEWRQLMHRLSETSCKVGPLLRSNPCL